MSEAALARLIAAEEALIAALDAGEVEAIERATEDFRVAVEGVRAFAAWRQTPAISAGVTQALQLAEAGRLRVNYLADRTRRRIDAIQAMRGRDRPGIAYGRDGRLRSA